MKVSLYGRGESVSPPRKSFFFSRPQSYFEVIFHLQGSSSAILSAILTQPNQNMRCLSTLKTIFLNPALKYARVNSIGSLFFTITLFPLFFGISVLHYDDEMSNG